MTVRVPDSIVDRPRREAALALGAAWLAFMTGLVVAYSIPCHVAANAAHLALQDRVF